MDIWEERESESDEGKDGLGDEPFAGRHLARRASKLKSSTSNDLAARVPSFRGPERNISRYARCRRDSFSGTSGRTLRGASSLWDQEKVRRAEWAKPRDTTGACRFSCPFRGVFHVEQFLVLSPPLTRGPGAETLFNTLGAFEVVP